MDIVSLLYNKIGIVCFKKRLFQKPLQLTAQVEITPGETVNLDLDTLALSLKKALSLLPKKTIRGKIKLILSQTYWLYNQVELPVDLSSQALSGFIKDQLVQQFGNLANTGLYHYIVEDFKGKKYAGTYLLTEEVLNKLNTLFSFYDLKIEEIYPEALLIFNSFANTLNKQKDEAALFLEYEKKDSSGLLFNGTGLLSKQLITFKSDNLNKQLKDFKKSQPLIISRLILGGKLSTQIRQDNFTKESGIWTNPLEKVLLNSPLKTTAKKLKLENKLLDFNREISLFNLIENKKNQEYALNIKGWRNKNTVTTDKIEPVLEPEVKPVAQVVKTESVQKQEPEIPILLPQESSVKPISITVSPPEQPKRSFKPLLKVLLIIAVSSILTYLLFTAGQLWLNHKPALNFPKINLSPPTPTPTPKPTPKATPTPEVTRGTVEIEILNGTGVAGMASSFQNELEKLGYVVNKIGNADNYDYGQTVIITQSQTIFTLLKKDLAQFSVKQPRMEKTNSQTTTIIFGTDLKLP